MSVIVAFGDFNTWGYDPATGGRFPRAQRWPSVLQRELGADFEVIAEGLNGRTTVHDDPIEPYRCGADALPACLMSHAPVDSRDPLAWLQRLEEAVFRFRLRHRGGRGRASSFSLAPMGNARTAARRKSSWSRRPRSPSSPAMRKCSRAARKSRVLLGQRYRDVAEREGVAFLDAGQVIRCSDLDGIHYEVDQHELLGRAVAEAVRGALAPPVVSIE